MEDSLRRAGLKYKVFGGTSFYKRKEIKDIVAYLRLAINPTDEQALVRVINYPTRGISDATVKSLTDFAAKNNISVWEAMDKTNEVGLANRAGNSVREFKKVIIRPCQEKAQTADAYESLKFIATHSGILKDLHADKTVEGLARWENIQELINAAKAFTESEADSTSLEAFLAEISLFAEADTDEKDDDFITLMTIHSAKGLEFKAVYLVGLEEGIFPGFNAIETRADLEEERRLFYVAVTRAEKKLTITYATSRLRYGNIQRNDPSRFLLEMDTKFLKHSKNQNVATTLPKTVPNMPNFKPVTTAQPKPQMQTPSMPNFVPTNPDKIAKGDIVIHQKFGKGTVLTREGVADNAKVTVDFEQGGQRVLLLKYAKLMVI
jgi:DNA helicase-2/ATP-dependent DNA helicase PcrA